VVDLNLHPDHLRKIDPEFNRLLNELGVYSEDYFMGFIFSSTGIRIKNYRIRAIPYYSVFLLNVRRLDNEKVNITYSLKEILNKEWWNNKKISRKIKKFLDKIYDLYVKPNVEMFEYYLKRRKERLFTPWKIRPFITIKREKARIIRKVICPHDGKEKPLSYCLYSCPHFVDFKGGVITCRFMPKIKT